MNAPVDSALYSMLPGPRAFMHRVAVSTNAHRHLVINHPHSFVAGLRHAVRRGLLDAHIDPENIVILTIHDDSDVAACVGVHFGQQRLTGAILAGITSPVPKAIVLMATGTQSQSLCDAYAANFRSATDYSHGLTRLVTLMQEAGFREDMTEGASRVITFDGGLRREEMSAYIAFRMVNQSGFGSTGLLSAIVLEFAGFDAEFAERLMLMDASQLLGIQSSLEFLMEEDTLRWQHASWLAGSVSHCSKTPHVLHDCYLAKYSLGDNRELARKRIEARYWRACVREIKPWIEEHRYGVLRVFYSKLNAIAASHPSGMIVIPSLPPHKERYVRPEDIETNNIVGMFKHGILSTSSDLENMALSVCRLIKPVRDAIAHLRAPSVTDLVELVRGVDQWEEARTRY